MRLDRPISNILSERGRDWCPNAPATEGDIAQLRELAPFDLPEEYVELLRVCDGGHGSLAAPPLRFHMDSAAASMARNRMWRDGGAYTSFWFIGTNGGLETIGFDLRSGPPWPIVMVDCIAGEDSATRIAPDMGAFVMKIGLSAHAG